MATLAEIRAKLKEQETRSSSPSMGGDNAIFPFWNVKDGETSVIRFLPDGDESNMFFWVERAMFKFEYPGIKGQSDSRPVVVQVPCMEMYGETCDILNQVRAWFKVPSLEEQGRKYWKKRSYLFQGLVVNSPLEEEVVPENPVRRFIIGSQIFNLVKSALLDPDMENLPTDYVFGTDFRIVKTSKGGYADYSTSNWARKERALSELEKKIVDEHGLHNLSSFLPKKPEQKELEIMNEMFEASVNGELYDMEKWGQYFRPPNVNYTSAATTTVQTPSVDKDETVSSSPSTESTDDSSAESNSGTASSGNAQDILAMIRARQNQ